ncbi:MAG: hypothetical protein ACM3L8_04875 [Verrucomicrobiota bacterium]
MEVMLSGTEVHVLRELLEAHIIQIGREESRAADAKILEELKGKDKVLKSIMEKLPVELATA